MERLTSDHLLKFGAKDVSSLNRIRFAFEIQASTLYVNWDKTQNNWWFEVEDRNGKVTPQRNKIKLVSEFQVFSDKFGVITTTP